MLSLSSSHSTLAHRQRAVEPIHGHIKPLLNLPYCPPSCPRSGTGIPNRLNKSFSIKPFSICKSVHSSTNTSRQGDRERKPTFRDFRCETLPKRFAQAPDHETFRTAKPCETLRNPSMHVACGPGCCESKALRSKAADSQNGLGPMKGVKRKGPIQTVSARNSPASSAGSGSRGGLIIALPNGH